MPKKLTKTTTKKEEPVKEVWIDISDTTKLRIEVSEFKGINRVDIREHIETEKYTGFTKKGVNIITNKVYELRDALNKIIETIEVEGLINDLETHKQDDTETE